MRVDGKITKEQPQLIGGNDPCIRAKWVLVKNVLEFQKARYIVRWRGPAGG